MLHVCFEESEITFTWVICEEYYGGEEGMRFDEIWYCARNNRQNKAIRINKNKSRRESVAIERENETC